MLELIFSAPESLQRLRENPLAPHLAAYATKASSLGYAPGSIKAQVYLLAHLGRWLKQRHRGPTDLDEATIDRFLALHHPRKGRGDRATLHRLLYQLREGGIASPRVVRGGDSAFHQLLKSYSTYLTKERGLTLAAITSYTPFVLRFLNEICRCKPPHFDSVSPSDISAFVVEHARSMPRKRSQLMCSALRSFCRFLLQKGLIAIDLAAAVPTVANWRNSNVPKFLSAAQIEQLLASCKEERSQRDYAILLLLARLGLRACEIVNMELGDIDWRAGEIVIRGKGRIIQKLPLPVDVGRAMSAYLRGERPSSMTRRLFIRSRAPYLGFRGSMAICTIVRRSLSQAAIQAPAKGVAAHLFRHSLATTMLRSGATLTEIGEVLRHRTPNTTEIYAKVDIEGLRTLALPWPTNEVRP